MVKGQLGGGGAGWAGARLLGTGPLDTLLVCSAQAAEAMEVPTSPLARTAGSQLATSLVSGFLLAVAKGPLCDEPMSGARLPEITRDYPRLAPCATSRRAARRPSLAREAAGGAPSPPASPRLGAVFLVEEVRWSDEADGGGGGGWDGGGITGRGITGRGGGGADPPAEPAAAEPAAEAGALPGQLIAAMREACRAAFLRCGTRLLEPVYRCEVQCDQEILGRMYAVLRKRRGEILAEDLREGTDLFLISASLPVVESFGFANDLRKNTSGAAHPQLVFSHYEALPQDPLFVVATEEEQEALDDGDLPTINLARKLMDGVRRRKGLRVEDKVVASATKQRTMSRKR